MPRKKDAQGGRLFFVPWRIGGKRDRKQNGKGIQRKMVQNVFDND
jgi:hypothetical protein